MRRPAVWSDAVRLVVGTLSVVPVPPPSRVDRAVAGRAMALAPLVGLVLGLAAAGLVRLLRPGFSPFLLGVLAIGLLALLTRGMHLDGLADTADGVGLGSRERALEVMRRSDIGPFGVVAVVVVLLLQVGSVAEAPWWALVLAVAIGRLGITVACTRPVPPARLDGLGAAVAGSVAPWVTAMWLVGLVSAGALLDGLQGVTAVGVGAAVAIGATAYATRRLGGVTGDVLGAVCELTTTATLLVLAVH